MTELTAEIIRTARESAGWSVAEAARELKRRSGQPLPELDSVVRSWKRWEKGTHPNRFYRPLLTGLLLSGETSDSPTVDLSGDWWSGWQSSRDGQEVLAFQPVRLRQRGNRIELHSLRRGRPVEDGGYLWTGELRQWDESLMGWYVADEPAVRSKGTLYLVLHPQGRRLTGRWVGLSWDGDTVTGLGVLARTEDDARQTMRRMIDRGTDR